MIIQYLIEHMQSLNPLAIKAIIFLFCMLSIVIFTKFFGKEGLYIYSVVAIIIANIQVLKAVKIYPFDAPIALGSVIFTSIFLSSDIITEFYGKEAAQKGVWLGFSASLFFSVIMILTIGIKPLESIEHKHFIDAHNSIAFLFTPSISILISSLLAYLASLWFDIAIFQAIKKITGEKLLWLRSICASSLGIILDNIIFSLCAWVIFAVIPIPISTVINTYILGTLAIRLVLTLITIPVFYWVRKIVRNSVREIK